MQEGRERLMQDLPRASSPLCLLQGAYGAHVVRTRDLHEAKIVLREQNHRQGFLPFTFEHVCEARE